MNMPETKPPPMSSSTLSDEVSSESLEAVKVPKRPKNCLLDQWVWDTLVEAIESGQDRHTACKKAGISLRSLKRYLGTSGPYFEAFRDTFVAAESRSPRNWHWGDTNAMSKAAWHTLRENDPDLDAE